MKWAFARTIQLAKAAEQLLWQFLWLNKWCRAL
jgi:hypothetical protein